MPRRTILSDAELAGLIALPDTEAESIRCYTFSDADLAIIAQHRGPADRLGFAVQLCCMRYPGIVLAADDPPPPTLLRLVAAQLKLSPEHWAAYGKREQTRREHLVELQTVFGFSAVTLVLAAFASRCVPPQESTSGLAEGKSTRSFLSGGFVSALPLSPEATRIVTPKTAAS